MSETRVKISTFIENQLPQFVIESSPLLIDFLRQYYVSIESQGQVLDILENIDQYVKLDKLTNIKNSTTLTSSISSFDTVIEVESTIGFPDSYGLIKIDDEIITYETKNDTSFINCYRGFSGIESYSETNFEKDLIFTETSVSDHLTNSVVENLSILFLKEFLTKIKYQFSPGFESKSLHKDVNENIFIKQVKDFYSSKGTISSFEILFKALYGEKVSVLRPSDLLLKPSSSNYLVTKDIVIEPLQGNPEELVNQTLFQDKDDYFEFSSASISKVEKIFRDDKEYYIISVDYDYNKDIQTKGSIIGKFNIHPKTKIIGKVLNNQNFIDVDSTIGFPNSGKLVVNKNGIDFFITYKSKTLNQFFDCESVSEIQDGSEIRLDSYAYGFSPKTEEQIKVRIGGVLSDLEILDNTFLCDVNDTVKIISPGKILNDARSKNWLYNVSVTYDLESPPSFEASNTQSLLTIDEHNFLNGDNITIEVSDGSGPYFSTVLKVNNKKSLIITPQIPVNNLLKYRVRRNLSKCNFLNYPELSNLNSNVQNLYFDVDNALYVTSPSIPNYSNKNLRISDGTIFINGSQRDSLINIPGHPFFSGDVVYYLYGDEDKNLDIQQTTYIIKKINENYIRLYKSFEDMLSIKYVTFADTIVSNNKLIPLKFYNKKLQSQKLIRKIESPKFDDKRNKTLPGYTGILNNGVEILNYKSNDYVYYGPLEKVESISDLDTYDVIQPNQVVITDPNGVGVGASILLHVTGNLRKINIVNPGFDYLVEPKISISGGNGRDATVEANLTTFTHIVNFNSSNSFVVNLSDDIISFSSDHRFRDIEKVVYMSNGESSIGGLNDQSSYYLKTINATKIKLYLTEQDSISGINTVNLTSLGSGIHSFKSTLKKKKIGSISIKNNGFNYSNKKIIVSSKNINVTKNTIYAKNHGYGDKEIISYYGSVQTTSIGNVPFGNYYVKYINENEFSLIRIKTDSTDLPIDFDFINNTIVQFTDSGSGLHYFNYPEITVKIDGIVGVNKFSYLTSLAEVQPIIKGKIVNTFLVDGGKKYGTNDIVNYERQPSFELIKGEGAFLKPIILNGRIEDVVILGSGKNYNSPPDIEITGTGKGAILTPIINDGQLIDVKIVNSGMGYGSNNTEIIVKDINYSIKFKSKIKSWNINNYLRYLNYNTLNENRGLLSLPLNPDYGIQYSHVTVPDSFREISLTSKIFETDEIFISDKENDQRNTLLKIHSPIFGWAYDGNPIYGPYGFDKPNGGIIRRMESGYILKQKNIDIENRPDYPLGIFVEDYEYIGIGDLDENNGRFCITPEFPNGTYAYFCTLDSEYNPVFPYIIGDYYKSKPIEFNFNKNSNQDNIDISKTKWLRNTEPYKLTSQNSNYSYLINPNKIKNQNSKISSIEKGRIDSIIIRSHGIDYSVGDNVIFESSESDSGFGASAQVSEIQGKYVDYISTTIQIVENVEFSSSSIFNPSIGISTLPHNLKHLSFISICNCDDQNAIINPEFYQIKVYSNELVLRNKVGNISETGEITYFDVYGNINYPYLMEDDIFQINNEKVKVLSVDFLNKRIKVLRGYDSTSIVSHSENDILTEVPRKFYPNISFEKNYKINRKYYFNPLETVGLGLVSGVGIGITLTFSNPGIGITQLFVPTKTLYIQNHNLNTGDKLLYNSNGGNPITVSTDGTNEFILNNNSVVYVAKISNDLIGLSTSRVDLSTDGNFWGISIDGSDVSTLFFKTIGSGTNHSLTTIYEDTFKSDVSSILARVNTLENHLLKVNDRIKLNVYSKDFRIYNIFYDSKSKNLCFYKTQINSIDYSNNLIIVQNHNYIRGQKVLFNSVNVPYGLEDSGKYYIIPINSNQIKLSYSYYGSLSNTDIVDIGPPSISSVSYLSLINPPLEVFKNNTIVFNLSDSSLEGFDFNLYEDKNYNNIFIGVNGFNVIKTGIPGNQNANLKLEVNSNFEKNLYYNLNIPDKNDILLEKLGYDVDETNITNNNTIIFKNSNYNGFHIINNVDDKFFEFNLNKIPEVSNNYIYANYINNRNSIINYTTNSKNSLGPISSIKINSGGKNYKKLPLIKEIVSEKGKNALIVPKTKSIGKIKKVDIKDIGFDYYSDNTIRPSSKIPVILKLDTLTSINEINVLSYGKNYNNILPNLVLVDGLNGNIIDDIILEFSLDEKKVIIIKNTKGINSVNPILIPTNNSNAININSIEYNNSDKEIKVIFDDNYSLISEFPFSEIVTKNTNIIQSFTTNIVVEDSSKIPEFSLIKIFNPNTSELTEEVLFVKSKNNNTLTVERGFFDTNIPSTSYSSNSIIILLENYVLIENTSVSDNGKSYNSENYNYKLYPVKQINPQIGGQNPYVVLDVSDFITDGETFGSYDKDNSFGIITPEKYFPIFDISLIKNSFYIGEEVISNNSIGIVESWDPENELLKLSTSQSFEINSFVIGKSSNSIGRIVDKDEFNSFYNIDSSSIVIKSWNDNFGFLNNDHQRIHDNYYYQYFSYSLKSKVQYSDWENDVSSLNHTSGFKKFSDLDIEVLSDYTGIQTSQNQGGVSQIVRFDTIIDLDCKYDYDLVSENNNIFNEKLVSDQIFFESKDLIDYHNCIGNRVLSIDDISNQFRSTERLNIVNRFNI